MTKYDVVVVGGGPAGLAFARGLAGTGLTIAVIERQSAETLAHAPVDGREIALTHRSVDTMKALGAWERIDPADISPLREAQVLNGASAFVLAFDPAGSTQDRLGYLVPNHCIRRALYAAAQGQAGLEIIAGVAVSAVRTDTNGAVIDLADGRRLTARLAVGADSRFSFFRDQLGIAAEINRLGRSMMCCRVTHERDHHGIATEWFDHGQTMAILPLNGRMSSAVLTLGTGEIDRICAMDWEALGAELTRRYEGRLGRMTVAEAPHAYPLATTWSRHFAAPSAALIGDTAVGMHPVTAHGFNLGLRSADKLASLIRDALAHRRDIASPMLLRRYEAAHRFAARPIYTGTNMLVGLFTTEHPAARAARFAALRAAARFPGIRTGVSRLLMQR
jgi:ubiquinone biosynthesis UbiH/UbiF/VisC/COQ6 family hydroxylase